MWLLSIVCYAQQKPIPTQYVNDKYIVNSAFAGSTNNATVSINAKQYLNGIEGAPQTQYLHVQYPLLSNFMGLGLKVMHDQIGVTTQNNVLITYAYQIGILGGSLSFALDAGLYNAKSIYSSLIIWDNTPDQAIPMNDESLMLPDASFGMFYSLNNIYLGYNAYNLIGGKTSYTSTGYVGKEALSKYHYIIGGYTLKPNKEIHIEPIILCKVAQAAPVQVDVSLYAQYAKLLSGGITYSTQRGMSVMLMAGFKEGQYKIGYSYDMSIPGNRASFLNAGHEIMLKYSLELTPPASQKDFNPIFYVN